jgi:hypothetical protein
VTRGRPPSTTALRSVRVSIDKYQADLEHTNWCRVTSIHFVREIRRIARDPVTRVTGFTRLLLLRAGWLLALPKPFAEEANFASMRVIAGAFEHDPLVTVMIIAAVHPATSLCRCAWVPDSVGLDWRRLRLRLWHTHSTQTD